MDEWWVWCASVVRGFDARYHMFASRWPRSLPFMVSYPLRSEIVRASADSPLGPYRFEEVVLPPRGPHFWDGCMTHNPTIHVQGKRFFLFYIGSTFDGAAPSDHDSTDTPEQRRRSQRSWENIRIGLAIADSPQGPWQRFDHPILDVAPASWDHRLVTNPAPCIRDDGRTLLLYRTPGPRHALLGAAIADQPHGPYRRLTREPIMLHRGHEAHAVEDPFVWWTGTRYAMLAKDLSGQLTGELHAGVYAESDDGVVWRVPDAAKAYSRTITWDDGSITTLGCLERPQLLMEQNKPTHLFAAAADGPGGFNHATRTWNLVIPLRT